MYVSFLIANHGSNMKSFYNGPCVHVQAIPDRIVHGPTTQGPITDYRPTITRSPSILLENFIHLPARVLASITSRPWTTDRR